MEKTKLISCHSGSKGSVDNCIEDFQEDVCNILARYSRVSETYELGLFCGSI